jgi:hypothetical protein
MVAGRLCAPVQRHVTWRYVADGLMADRFAMFRCNFDRYSVAARSVTNRLKKMND